MLPAVGYSAAKTRTPDSPLKYVTALHIGQSVLLVASLRENPESVEQLLGDHNDSMVRTVDLAKLASGMCESPEMARVVGFGDLPGLIRVSFDGLYFNVPMDCFDWLQVPSFSIAHCGVPVLIR